MARKEETGLIEQHVEKIALGIALVILIVVGLHWGLESPRRIKLGINARGVRMQKDECAPDEVDDALEDASDKLEDWLEDEKRFSGTKPVPNYVKQLKKDYETPYNTGRVHIYTHYRQDRMLPNLFETQIRRAEPTSLAALTPLPQPEKPLVKVCREVQVEQVADGETKFTGVKIAHGAAVFEYGKVLEKWKQALKKTYVPPRVVFFAVEVRRRHLLTDGSWSKSEPVAVAILPELPVIPAPDEKNFLEIQKAITELSWITNQADILERPCSDIVWSNRQPGTWQIENHKARTRVSDLLDQPEEETPGTEGRREGGEREGSSARRNAERIAAEKRAAAKRAAAAAAAKREAAKRAAARRAPGTSGRGGRSGERERGGGGIMPTRRDNREVRPTRRDGGEMGPIRRDDERGPIRRDGPGRRPVAAGPDAPKLVLIPTLQEQLDNPAGILEVWFHDTNLKDGMTYSYQLRLVLVNPLLGRFKDVANKDDAKVKFVHTPWSQWSEPVGVKRPTEFFLVGSAPQMGTVTLEVFTRQWGQLVSHRFTIGKGVPIGGEVRKELLRLGGGEQEETLVNFKTGAIAVNFNFKKKQRIPGTDVFRTTTELLYLDTNGRLRTRTQNDSSQRYKDLHKEVLQSARTASSGVR